MPYPIIKYTNPASVLKIMKAFGSKGFINSPDGLVYCNNNKVIFTAKKGQSITKDKKTEKIIVL